MRANGLGVRYRRTWALRDCSFELPPGSVTALVGANGAGKSTLLLLAAGLRKPTEGTVEVRGDVGFVAQEKPLYRGFTVAETLRFGRAANPTWDRDYAERLVTDAGLPMGARVGGLSGGHRARLALALALGRRPRVLLLDEPMAEMDPVAREATARTLMVVIGIVAAVGLRAAVRLHRSGDELGGVLTCALTALLVSPVSWHHHWVWCVPALLWLRGRAVAVLFAAWPLPGDAFPLPQGLLPWLTDLYALAGLGALVLVSVKTTRDGPRPLRSGGGATRAVSRSAW